MIAAATSPCAPWCTVTSHEEAHDPACWGPDREVGLTLEEGYPRGSLPEQALVDGAPRVGVYAYRLQPGYRQVAYLHVYRPSDNDHHYLDNSLHLSANEAVELAKALLDVAEEIGGLK
ncbi:hypothetical protein [Mycolicibacterium mengxianglii]|uniref:hypothetical protein n=1 Tax=Mycolicibacterium mengxianglii TaxID=2736649 RepID=UPI0018D1EE7C|nr:hypothetical protein [Mycolicibacterium mengxianglii]